MVAYAVSGPPLGIDSERATSRPAIGKAAGLSREDHSWDGGRNRPGWRPDASWGHGDHQSTRGPWPLSHDDVLHDQNPRLLPSKDGSHFATNFIDGVKVF
jgi:hypothetical protein